MKKKIACVRHRDGWCACLGKTIRYRDSVRTLCRYFVTLPWGLEYRQPTCKECLKLLSNQKQNDWVKLALAFIKKQTYPTYIHGEAPTVRELARRYRVSQQEVVDALESHESVCMNVGLGTSNGVFEYESVGDYSFEWMDN